MIHHSHLLRSTLIALGSCAVLTHCILPHAEGPGGVDRVVVPTDMVSDRAVSNDVDVPTVIADVDVVAIDMPNASSDADVLVDVPDVFDVPNDRFDVVTVDMPNPPIDRPNVDIPNVDIPNVDIPNVDVPNVDIPNVDIPNVDVPNVDVPSLPVRCADIIGQAGVQVRQLQGGNGPWNALCDFASAGGPWTLVAKVDGSDPEWRYSSVRWTDSNLINSGNVNASRESAKYAGFLSLSFTSMRLITETNVLGNWEPHSLNFSHNSMNQSLQQMFVGGGRIPIVGTTRASWRSLLPFDPQLQQFCDRIGFNNASDNGADRGGIRIGALANENNDCNDAASWIGAGGFPNDSNLSAGNRNSPIGFSFRRTPAWFFIWVR